VKKIYYLLGALIFLSTVNANAWAFALLNGNFETGTFFDWDNVGEVSIETADFGSNPTNGNYQALLSTGFNAASSEEVWAFSEILPRTSQSYTSFNVGSSIKNQFLTLSSATLTIDWNWLLNSYSDANSENTARFRLGVVNYDFKGNVTSSSILHSGWGLTVNPSGSGTPSETAYEWETGYHTWETSLAPGWHTFEAAILNMADSREYGLLIDNARLATDHCSPVPEPATITMLGLGLLGMAGVSRKKIKKLF
jgi:hypothetical protein